MLDKKYIKSARKQKSFRGRSWLVHESCNKFREVKQQIFFSRNIEDIDSYIDPKIMYTMPDPKELPDIDTFIDLISKSKKVGLFGDYDVDGIASVAIWIKVLNKLGIESVYYIPSRSDGYGVSNRGLDFLMSKEIDMILFLDCGSSSIDLMQSIKVNKAIIDHHQASEFAQVDACINPYRTDFTNQAPYKSLCSAGLSFLVIARLLKCSPPEAMAMLDLAGIATVADIMPMNSFNRACVRRSLALMNKGQNLGLKILADVLKLKLPLTSTSLSFYIIPALNAAGRLGNPELSLKLLISKDAKECRNISNQLEMFNKQRKMLTQTVFEMAKAQVSDEDNFIAVKGQNWHPGIVGITASQLKDTYNKTAFVFYGSGDMWKGSGRSDEINLGQTIIESVSIGLTLSGGGHAAAGGISIHSDSFEDWKEWMSTRINQAEQKEQQVIVDAVIPELLLESMPTFYEFGPFGNGNSSPNLLVEGVWLSNVFVGPNYIQCILSSGLKIPSFRINDNMRRSLINSVGKILDLLLKVDEYGGLTLEDARASDASFS